MRERIPSRDKPAGDQDGCSSPSRRKWSNFLPLLVFLVVVAEITLLGRLDMAKNAAMVNTWAHTFYTSSRASINTENDVSGADSVHKLVELDSCEEWLERADTVNYTRDLGKDPIFITGFEQESISCSLGCRYGYTAESGKKPDATFSLSHDPGVARVLRSMESSHYYSENNIDLARRRGYNIVMTTSLSSDVPVGYFSWAEYDIMAPMIPKTEKSLAAAFISNCGARNFRLEALVMLEKMNITIDSYGGCHRNRDGRVNKVKTLKRYKFSLAFENSNEEDYVTEKFFQSLVAGTIPVVVGAPNIQEFAPSPHSILHIRELSDVGPVAKKMKYLAGNPELFNNSLRWKYEGPSDSFKALVDMAAVHSSCRLCIYVATKIRERDERIQSRPCRCTRGVGTVYHLFVRERGRFEMESIFLRSDNLTLNAMESTVLQKFQLLNHVPVWKKERPEVLRGRDNLKIYKVYPVGLTQRQALYTFRFHEDEDFRQYVERNPCSKFEVIFV
ncbi:glycoprotein 3-alpha-L-fucosyltransferase A-like [Aristolochia californica]|uniref:glycoprotein 3-alpha-L-fucosyltransferase A-like n=1 Tax=Aristolochia californica TaxID=171875 RepID=UPI0035DBC322